jgi:predicted chitinase
VEQAQKAAPRCLTPGQRQQYHLAKAPPHWCAALDKWPYDGVGALSEASRLLSRNRDNEAGLIFEFLRGRDPRMAGRIDATRAKILVERGSFILKNDREEENADESARAQFEAALGLDPRVVGSVEEIWAATQIDRGAQALDENRFDDAKGMFHKARSRKLDDAVRAGVFDAIASHWLRRGKAAEGLKDAQEALALAPKNGKFLATRGLIHLETSSLDAACADLELAIANGADAGSSYFGLGRCRELKGDKELALAAYRKVLEPADGVAPGASQQKARQRLLALAAPLSPVDAPSIHLDQKRLLAFAPRILPSMLQELGSGGDEVLKRFGINASVGRFCHFLAQVSFESSGFSILEENFKYSETFLNKYYRVPPEEARTLVGKPEAIAERIYGVANPRTARILGNVQPGDGFRYRGRGLLQIVGRHNYRDLGKRIGVDLESDPDLAAQPLMGLLTAAAFWDVRKLNTFADQDNTEVITKRINGGLYGLAERSAGVARCLVIWSSPTDADAGPAVPQEPGKKGG